MDVIEPSRPLVRSLYNPYIGLLGCIERSFYHGSYPRCTSSLRKKSYVAPCSSPAPVKAVIGPGPRAQKSSGLTRIRLCPRRQAQPAGARHSCRASRLCRSDLHIYPSICPCIYSSTYHLFVYVFIHLSICLPIHLSVCLCAYPSIYLSVYAPIHLSICLSIYPSIYSSIYLSVYLCIHPSNRLCVYPSTKLSINLPSYLTAYTHTAVLLYIHICVDTKNYVDM